MSEWISVKESLPNFIIDVKETVANGYKMPAHSISDRCLVVVNNHVTESKLLLRADMQKPIWTMLDTDQVTHWMPLPAPPEQK